MGCYDDMLALLDDVAEIRSALEREYAAACGNPDIKTVLRTKVKSALEQLRSVLEYSAHELRDKHCGGYKPDDRVYFPYARTKSRFEKIREKNLPGLITASPEAAAVVASIQPFTCGDDWLIRLCDQVNFNKHQRLEDQVRVNSQAGSYSVGNLVRIGSENTRVVFEETIIHGRPLADGKPMVFTSGMTDDEIAAQLGSDAPNFRITREFSWVEFRFASSAEDALQLIGKAHDEIAIYTDAIKAYF